jgi:hypothetical protein
MVFSNLTKSPPGAPEGPLVEGTYDLNPKSGVSRKGFCLQKVLFVFCTLHISYTFSYFSTCSVVVGMLLYMIFGCLKY